MAMGMAISAWHWVATARAERELLTQHCGDKTSMAMQIYDRIRAGDIQQANDVWEQSVYQNITNLIRQGKLSTAIKSELFKQCMGEYV